MTDTERLSWLEQYGWSANPSFHYGSLSCNLDLPWSKTGSSDKEDLRSAIDEMMRKQTEGKL